jgi:hypothetical protein
MDLAKHLLIPVSAGELIDKITILEIKAQRFADPEQLSHVRYELNLLREVQSHSLASCDEVQELTRQLKSVNEELWQIENALRSCEGRKEFGAGFIALARSVYRTNDRRCALKRQINELAGSSLIEEKLYAHDS